MREREGGPGREREGGGEGMREKLRKSEGMRWKK